MPNRRARKLRFCRLYNGKALRTLGRGLGSVSDLFIETHGRGRSRLNHRLVLDGGLWVFCYGAAWRDMPERFGPWSTVHQRFRVAKSTDPFSWGSGHWSERRERLWG